MQMALEGLPQHTVGRHDVVHAFDPRQFQRGT